MPGSEAFLALMHLESSTAIHASCLLTMKPLLHCHQLSSVWQCHPASSKSSCVDREKASLPGNVAPHRSIQSHFTCVFYEKGSLLDDTPNALVEFALLRSDGEQIYNSLICRRKQINEAFGGSLLWVRNARSPEQPFPYHAIAWTIACPSLRELDRESWSAVQSQMIDAMVRLERAVVPYLQRWLEED